MNDLIVIGAGIQGASAAYNLAKRNFGRILVLEQGAFDDMRGATHRSASMIMQQTGDRELSRLARRSYRILQSLEAELEVKVPFVETGSILYGTREESRKDHSIHEQLRVLFDFQNELGIETEWIDGVDLPALSAGMLGGPELTCGIYCEKDGFTDGTAIRNAYLDAFRRLGGQVRFDSKVVEIRVARERVQAIVLANGEVLRTNAILNCAGIHADTINDLIGAPLPLTVDRRFLAVLERSAQLPDRFPIIEDHRHEWYFRPHPKGVLMGIGPTTTLDKDSLQVEDPALDEASIELLRRYVARYVPPLVSAQIIESWAGRRPMISGPTAGSPGDVMPRVGAVGSLDGMYQSAGWGAFGVTLAFVGGELAAESICEGRMSREPEA